jgi:hypothetical protein
MDNHRRVKAAIAIGIFLSAGIIGAVLSSRGFFVHADPFGSKREMWASLDGSMGELLRSNPNGYSKRLVDHLARITATKSKFEGSPRELFPFLHDLDTIPSVRQDDLQGSREKEDDRSILANSLTAIARAWFEVGPYRDGTTEYRVLHHAMRSSASDDRTVATQAALLLRVVSMKWNQPDQGDPFPKSLPTEVAERVRQIEEHPPLRYSTDRAILAMRGKAVPDPTPEELAMLKDWKPLDAP